jgi:uncharacterized protein (DUF4415 family)
MLGISVSASCLSSGRSTLISRRLRWQSTRRKYGELRYVGIGYLDSRLHVLCFSESETGIRVISFRKANSREAKTRYETRGPLTDEEGEVRELMTADLEQFRAAEEILPPPLAEMLGAGKRGPQRAPTKERITIRLSRDVVARFRATGEGWQTRLDTALRDWLDTHSTG